MSNKGKRFSREFKQEAVRLINETSPAPKPTVLSTERRLINPDVYA